MDKLLTVSEVADLLHCHRQTVYRNKDLPLVVIPGIGKRYRLGELEKYLAGREVRPPVNISQAVENKDIYSLYAPGFDTINSGGYCGMPKGKTKSRFNFGYGAIYQRKTKKGKIRWYLDYRDAAGKRVQKVAASATTLEEATLALHTEISKVFDNAHGVKRRIGKISFHKFSKVYLQDYAMQVKKSWSTDESRLKTLKTYFKQPDLRDITPLSIQRFISKREKFGNRKSTINRYLALLKKMFNLAIEEGYLEENPVSKVKLFSEKDNLQERILTPGEEVRLKENCVPHLRSMIIVALNTGMRLGEIRNLKWSQVNLKDRIITAEKTKSGRDRHIPVNDALFTELSALRAERKRHTFVFTNQMTGKPFVCIKTGFSAACRRAKIDHLRFHDLRHTFGSRLIQNGVDIETVRSLLGHSSIAITQRYIHSTDERRKAAVKTLAEKTQKDPQITEDLLHICDMDKLDEKPKSKRKATTCLFSVN